MSTKPVDDPSPWAGGEPPKREPSAYERLKEAILSGEITPGQPLVETQLAKWCGVSRTPVREALKRLEQDGIVERGDRGLVVRENSPAETLDIYETRIVLETKAARVAAQRRTDNDLLIMKQLNERMHQMDTSDPQRMARSNAAFHRAVWRATHNESLIDLLERLQMHVGRYPTTTLSWPGRWEASTKEHDELIRSIEMRDEDGAGRAAEHHFAAARDIRLSLFTAE
jgi:DNA-binding GntR family transcriptional regulator